MGKSLAVFHHGCVHVVVILVLVFLLDHHGSFVISSSSSSSTEDEAPAGGIAVLGLGRMGSAVARCLAGGEEQEQEQEDDQAQAVLRRPAAGRSVRAVVHAWNRSPPRHLTDDDPSTNTTILLHSTLEYAVGNATTTTTGLVLVVIDDWTGARQVTRNVARYIAEREREKPEGARPTIVVFSTYTPDEMQDLFDASSSSSSQSLQSSQSHTMNLVGGAIVGIPETICSTASLVLLSASSSSTGQAVKALLDPLGTVVSIDADAADDVEEEDPSSSSSSSSLSNHNNNNVGSASLLNIALILTITFGLAGSELALLMIQSAASINSSNNSNNDRPTSSSLSSSSSSLLDVYDQLARDVAVSYIRLLVPLVSTAFRDGSYRATYVPAPTLHGLLYKVCRYLHVSLGIPNDTFLDAYVASLGAVRDPDQGPVAWIKPRLPSSSSSSSSTSSSTTITTTTSSTTTEMSPPSPSSEKEEL